MDGSLKHYIEQKTLEIPEQAKLLLEKEIRQLVASPGTDWLRGGTWDLRGMMKASYI